MPIGYLSRAINRFGTSVATRKRMNLYIDPATNTPDHRKDTHSEISFQFIPTSVSYQIKMMSAGWSSDTDDIIWVDPDFDISTNDDYNSDHVIMNGREYLVTYVRRMDMLNHNYKEVGLQKLTRGGV